MSTSKAVVSIRGRRERGQPHLGPDSGPDWNSQGQSKGQSPKGRSRVLEGQTGAKAGAQRPA